MEAQKLDQMRVEASQQSLGMSHHDIYGTILNILKSKNIDKSDGSLLDVGAGVGGFVQLLKQKTNYKLFAVDLMFSRIPGVEWFVQDLNRDLQLQNEKFEIVTCIEVLEHVENPRKLMRDMFRVLKPGGIIVYSTPNNHSWRAILSFIFRDHFVAFTDSSYPAHITAINKVDMARMAKEAGFVDIEFEFTDSGVLPKFTSLTWQKISWNLFKGLRFSDNIVCVAKKPKLSAVSSV